ncbi:DUF1573 domain-containing protein [Aurantibacillus circumpalustris]|uniref:DUF1573 domain-containing protein n=1 Tax=Aurantibacillus circumpalustris TaxID=3036359 RepID=UPI00295AE80D|nr:DUF1573 domain-containing protein [Aurantibacillus circumpalustris]
MRLSLNLALVVNPINIFRNPQGNALGIFYLKVVSLFILLFLSFNSYSQAKLKIPETKKNFGLVKRGEIIKNEFEISNSGDAPLLINDIEISCSCTTVDFPKQPILPDQSSKITVIFNTTTVYGRQDRVVYVNSNDPNSPHKLRYKGTVSAK